MAEIQENFPRSEKLPNQSPIFWATQKDRYLRQLLIRDIEKITERRLVVYFANRFANAQIDGRDVAYMAELLGDVGDSPIDLLLETVGGLTDATEALISLIQTTVNDFRVIVANAAKSNGTLLCLAAKTVVMGPTSELGPIEPLVQGIPCSILEKPNIASQNFPLHMYGVYALKQTSTLANTLLTKGMMNGRPAQEIEETVKKLASRETFFSHGSVISAAEAKGMGLNVEYWPPENDAWKRVWLLHCMYEHDCQRDQYLKIFEGNSRSMAIAAPKSAAVPA